MKIPIAVLLPFLCAPVAAFAQAAPAAPASDQGVWGLLNLQTRGGAFSVRQVSQQYADGLVSLTGYWPRVVDDATPYSLQ